MKHVSTRVSIDAVVKQIFRMCEYEKSFANIRLVVNGEAGTLQAKRTRERLGDKEPETPFVPMWVAYRSEADSDRGAAQETALDALISLRDLMRDRIVEKLRGSKDDLLEGESLMRELEVAS